MHKTINSLLENAEGTIEIIVVLDGYNPLQPIKTDPRLRVLQLKENRGMRGAINVGLAEAKGDFVMKIDSHCKVGKGFDRIMAESCAENWLMIPRRYTLNLKEWRRGKDRDIKDYHYLSFPKPGSRGLTPREWRRRTYERFDDPKFAIDDTMSFQGSCWLANREYFMKQVGFLDDRPETYSTFAGDQLEIGLKYWLNGGEIKVIKKTWYAHLFKNTNYYKGQPKEIEDHKKRMKAVAGYKWAVKHWMNNEEPNMLHKFEWLVEKFWPVPMWESNWREVWSGYNL